MVSPVSLRIFPNVMRNSPPAFLPLPLPFRPRTFPLQRYRVHVVSLATASNSSSPSSPTSLVIVESPAKAVTIQKYLPSSQYCVRSCVGHIRELPSSAKRIPAKYKNENWARLGVDIEDNFKPLYVLISGKQSLVTQLKSELASCCELILATDEDREGEAISWHLAQVLKPSVPVKRAVFHEITPEAVRVAFANCRAIDMQLVQAQETRRVLDRLAGYTMSPLLWKKIAKGLSAGRVQSVAMSVVVRRELDRLVFVKGLYSGCVGMFGGQVEGQLSGIDRKRVVRGGDFDAATGKVRDEVLEKGVWWFKRKAMEDLLGRMRLQDAIVEAVDKRRTSRKSPVPFITSTLQQECGNKFGMGVGRTMRIAQKLYENGFITYMRTDNPSLSEQAVTACREAVGELYGDQFLSEGRQTVSKPKRAQAAHEAIRPAGSRFARPEELRELQLEERKVYGLIFRRTLASQMKSAKLDQTTIRIHVPLKKGGAGKVAEFKATGSVVVELGFLKAYLADDLEQTSGSYLPVVEEGQLLPGTDLSILDQETKPPARYNDASLVKELEELGVGRPSTYASTIEKLITRGYIYRGRMLGEEKAVSSRALVPSLTAFAVDKLLSTHFPSFVDAEFTARMEEVLDEIAAGSEDRTKYLTKYYCGSEGLAESVKKTEDEIHPRLYRQILLPNMPKEMLDSAAVAMEELVLGKEKKSTKASKVAAKRPKKKTSKANQSLRDSGNDGNDNFDWSTTRVLVSSYGPYIEQDGEVVVSLPKTTMADDLSADRLGSVLQIAQDPVFGTDPVSGKSLLLKTSRYGPYVQLGRDEDAPEGTKPKRCSLFPGMDVGDLTVDVASKLLCLPRLLGSHPQSGHEVRAAMGPYGPYVVHGETYVSLKKGEHDVLEIGLDKALQLVDAAEARKEIRRLKQEQKAEERKKTAKITTKNAKDASNVAATKAEQKSAPKQRTKQTTRTRQKTAATQSF